VIIHANNTKIGIELHNVIQSEVPTVIYSHLVVANATVVPTPVVAHIAALVCRGGERNGGATHRASLRSTTAARQALLASRFSSRPLFDPFAITLSL
jgi:hypothetical protein